MAPQAPELPRLCHAQAVDADGHILDHPPDYLANLEELVKLLPASARPKVLGRNVLQCYGIE